MVFVENSNFLSGVFFKSSNERSFSDIPNRKEWFLQIKKETFKKRPKNQNFPKGLVHTFRQKLELFFWCFFLNQATTDRPDQKKKRPEKTTFIKIKNIELYESILFVKKS